MSTEIDKNKCRGVGKGVGCSATGPYRTLNTVEFSPHQRYLAACQRSPAPLRVMPVKDKNFKHLHVRVVHQERQLMVPLDVSSVAPPHFAGRTQEREHDDLSSNW